MASTRTLLTALTALVATAALGFPVAAVDLADLADAPGLDAPTATPTWSALGTAQVRPGVQMVTAGAQCTSNFVFYEQTGPSTFDVYLGYAAHCAGTGGATSTNGCTTGSLALGTPVSIRGRTSTLTGTLAYSSWHAMQQPGAPHPAGACAYNDFALVKIKNTDIGKINPSVHHFGGPTGLCASPTGFGNYAMSYGNSGLRLGLDPVAPKVGYTLYGDGTGWSTQVYMVTPGIPGDSGSGYMNGNHCAWGVTSTVQLAPYALSNGIGSIQKAVAYAAANGGPDVVIATAAPITTLPI